jgi:hypothetical protein
VALRFNGNTSDSTDALPNSWNWYTGSGSDSFLYTVWAVVNINGQWYASGIVQMWPGRLWTGAPVLTDFARSWVYDGRWGPMQGYQPTAGTVMGFFASAGNARSQSGVTSVRERTNVVLVTLVPDGSTSYSVGSLPMLFRLPRR